MWLDVHNFLRFLIKFIIAVVLFWCKTTPGEIHQYEINRSKNVLLIVKREL